MKVFQIRENLLIFFIQLELNNVLKYGVPTILFQLSMKNLNIFMASLTNNPFSTTIAHDSFLMTSTWRLSIGCKNENTLPILRMKIQRKYVNKEGYACLLK